MYKRISTLPLSSKETCFLWGPRQVGKTSLLKQLFPRARRYDLLLSTEFRRLSANPALIRQECEALGLSGSNQESPIIIDEIQKIPELLDEVHWLIENRGLRFVLCGSSARKLKRSCANLLGGRAIRYELFPLVYPEIPDFSLSRAINHGLVPRHYISPDSWALRQSYIGEYLKEEIQYEARLRNLAAFNRFLEVSALTCGEIVNYENIARECAVSAPTAREYFQILVDTLLGFYLPAYVKRAKRRLVRAPKFYLFDVGVAAALTRRRVVEEGTELFGKAFEHFICQQLVAHASYSGLSYQLTYWRTSSGFEVDFVLGDCQAAVEVKAAAQAHDGHLKGLRAFGEEYPGVQRILVSLDASARQTADGIRILPWRVFLDELFGGRLIKGWPELCVTA